MSHLFAVAISDSHRLALTLPRESNKFTNISSAISSDGSHSFKPGNSSSIALSIATLLFTGCLPLASNAKLSLINSCLMVCILCTISITLPDSLSHSLLLINSLWCHVNLDSYLERVASTAFV